MTDGLSRPLTPVERMVCDCIARGWKYPKIASQCQISVRTAYVHVHNIAEKLPPEDDVRPYQRVFLWLQHRRWLDQHVSDAA